MKYYEVCFEKNGVAAGKKYTYGFNEELKKGQRVDLPFGYGVVMEETSQEKLDTLDIEKIKKIVRVVNDEEGRNGQADSEHGVCSAVGVGEDIKKCAL